VYEKTRYYEFTLSSLKGKGHTDDARTFNSVWVSFDPKFSIPRVFPLIAIH